MTNSEWILVKMNKAVVANLEADGIKYTDTRLQPFITWLQFMNFITIAILSLVFLKIYNGILLLYEWIFPFKHNKLRYPLILVSFNTFSLKFCGWNSNVQTEIFEMTENGFQRICLVKTKSPSPLLSSSGFKKHKAK